MGDVYRATDPRLGRDVALKTLTSAERGDGHAVERFLQEARITASLDHPNIVRVFDVGMSNGRPYLVSELLDGETLRAPIGRGPLAPADARSIASALTSGLVAAHARGLVHRDLKPENTFAVGCAKILTSASRARSGSRTATRPRDAHRRLGNGRLPREQVRGDPVDARTDLFALGSIVFELITGQRAFAREHTIDTLHAIVHDDPPDLLPHGIALTSIVRRLLAKAPDARFQSATDLLWALEQIDANRARTVARITPGSRFFPHRTRMGHRGRSRLRDRPRRIALDGPRTCINRVGRAEPTQFTWSLSKGTTPDSHRSSPDGRSIAFTADSGGATRLFVRSLDSRDATWRSMGPAERSSHSRRTARRSGFLPAANS
jgi:serine/threonine protein kinase